MIPGSSYKHTQTAPLGILLFALGVGMFVGAWFVRDDPVAVWVLPIMALLVCVFAFSFQHLTVEDEGDRLAVRFGPLPLFCKRIAYGQIQRVEADRTTLVDGWGIHYVPGRGWTYNLWGFDCVKLTLNGRMLRIGSDDVENLLVFLRSKTGGEG
ncbi:MAG TPA: hypothetical protein VE890_17250 [Thermoguttaceae bacterium]|nr:hypothetical protein [Thermoguttaceae bacterium]